MTKKVCKELSLEGRSCKSVTMEIGHGLEPIEFVLDSDPKKKSSHFRVTIIRIMDSQNSVKAYIEARSDLNPEENFRIELASLIFTRYQIIEQVETIKAKSKNV